jgi:hypothetical protein
MAKTKVYISSASIVRAEIDPIWTQSLQYERQRGQVFFRNKLKGEMTIGGLGKNQDWILLQDVVNDPFSCEVITVEVERECSGSYSVFWKGEFTMLEAKVDLVDCTVTVKPRVLDDYTDFFQNLGSSCERLRRRCYRNTGIHGRLSLGSAGSIGRTISISPSKQSAAAAGKPFAASSC